MSARPSRRAVLLAAGAAAVLPGAVAATAASPDPDAALIAAAEEVRALQAEEDRIAARPYRPFGGAEALAEEKEVSSLIDRRRAAIELAIETPARTAAGVRAKAEILLNRLPCMARDCALSEDDEEIRLAVALAEDILRAGGAA